MLAGVGNGLAAYFNVDPTLVRLALVFLTLFWGMGILVYFIMAVVVPEARSPEEKAAASGFPATAQEFIRRAKEGYYEAMKNFPDRKAHREWARQFRQNMRAHGDYWRYRWHGGWHPPVASPAPALALPLLSLIHGVVMLICICALISLLASGTMLGAALPANVPVWLAALLLLIVYGILVAPLKLARHWCYHGLDRLRAPSILASLLDAVIWLVFLIILLWLALHYFPQLHQAFQSIPAVIHQAADDFRNWWHGK